MRGWLSLVLLTACAGAPTPSRFVSETRAGRVASPGETYAWRFDETTPMPGTGSVSPATEQARVFENVLGKWREAKDLRAPSAPNVYQQSARYGARDEPRVVVADVSFADQTARVKCRPDSEEAIDACGLMFHVVDSDHYLVARAEAAAGVVRLVHVDDGVEREVASARAEVLPRDWHEIEVTTRGSRIVVAWDGARLIDAQHDDGVVAGRVGLWTKGASLVSFDDFVVRAE